MKSPKQLRISVNLNFRGFSFLSSGNNLFSLPKAEVWAAGNLARVLCKETRYSWIRDGMNAMEINIY